jgi:uncharacterized surface anchored protein
MLLGLAAIQAPVGRGQEASPIPVTGDAPQTPAPEIPPTETATPSPTQPVATATSVPPTATAEVQIGETTGTIVITTVDENGVAVSGACFSNDATYQPVCDSADGANDSVTTIASLPAGQQIRIWQTGSATGYAKAEMLTVTLLAGETKSLQVINPHAATLVIHPLDGDGNPALNMSYALFKDAGGGALGTKVIDANDAQDGAVDGVVTMTSLLPGNYVLGESGAPQYHVGAANISLSLSAGETKTIEIPHTPYSTLVIHTEDMIHTSLLSARYEAFKPDGPSRGSVGMGCDGCFGDPLDGTTTLRVPPGTWRVEQTIRPAGYLWPPSQTITVGERETLELTYTNEAGAIIVVHATDVWGTPIEALSWNLYEDAGGGTRGKLVEQNVTYGEDGVSTFPPVPAGAYLIESSYISDTLLPAKPVQVTVTLGQHLDVTIPVPEHAPKLTTGPWIAEVTQTTAVITWGTDQQTIGYVDYGLTKTLGRVRPRGTPAPATSHQVTLDSLTPGTLYYFRVRSTSPNGDAVSEIFSFRTPATTANATVEIKKVDSSGNPLSGSCFEVYLDAGSGRLGAIVGETCDKYDTDPDNGTLRVNGLKAGAYVLVESRAPAGYALAAPIRFGVTSGQTKTITVTNYRGGSTLNVTATAGFGKTTPGACFELYKDVGDGRIGAYVASSCDDYDGFDAVTSFIGLRAGDYVIREWFVPLGYIRGVDLPVTIGTRETRSVEFINPSETNGRAVRLRAAASAGNLLPGACFIIFPNLSQKSFYACDSWDGRNDGQTFFTDVADGSYTVFETIAPKGYIVGKSTTFTKSFNRHVTRTFTQVKGGTTVTVKTLNGGTTTPLKGACYALYKTSTGALTTFACDADGTADGATSFSGVPAGTYYLDQISTPAGYTKPKMRTITVGTTSTTVTVRTYR